VSHLLFSLIIYEANTITGFSQNPIRYQALDSCFRLSLAYSISLSGFYDLFVTDWLLTSLGEGFENIDDMFSNFFVGFDPC
jgi:hypothetical protein